MTEDDTFDALKKTPFHIVFNYIQEHKYDDRSDAKDAAYLKVHGWTLREYDAMVQEVYYPPIPEEDRW